jgi:hypothetical protein
VSSGDRAVQTWSVTAVDDVYAELVTVREILADRVTVESGCLLAWVGEETVLGWSHGAWRSFRLMLS